MRHSAVVSKSLIGVGLTLAAGGLVLLFRSLGAPRSRLSPSDQDFVKSAAQDGLEEVEAGHLAQQQGQSDDVRRFGQHMVEDHSRVNSELTRLAMRKGFVPPGYLPATKQAKLQMLSRLPASAFDQRYIDSMIGDHKKAISLFEREAAQGTDPEIRDFAKKTLPTLREHLQRAQGMQRREQPSQQGATA